MANTLATAELEAEIRNLESTPRPSDVEGRKARNSQRSELEAQWREGLNAEFANDLPKVAQDEVFSFAWEAGHASGYSEVRNYFIDFAEFARKVRNAK